MTPSAFAERALPSAARLNAMFGSDIGHWDVKELFRVVPAWEPVEKGILSPDEFRAFACDNVIRFDGYESRFLPRNQCRSLRVKGARRQKCTDELGLDRYPNVRGKTRWKSHRTSP